VLRALGLGDLLTSVPALRGLREHHAAARITLAVPAWLAPLALHTGLVDATLDVRSPDGAPPVGAAPELAVNLHGRGPQSHRWLLAARPSGLIAFHHADIAASRNGPDWDGAEHEVRRWCRLLSSAGIDAHPERIRITAPVATSWPHRGPDAGRPRAIIHAGAKDGARRWPAERWAAVIRRLSATYDIVLTGSSGERWLASWVAHAGRLPASTVVAGRTDVLELAAVVAAADLVLSGDTGVAHLATALGRPSVVLFGPTDPSTWGPPNDPRHIVLWTGRTGDPHAGEPFDGLLEIGVEDVLDAAERAARGRSAARGRRAEDGARFDRRLVGK
jgi:ADP-heptose:LPS heptosyltransferase